MNNKNGIKRIEKLIQDFIKDRKYENEYDHELDCLKDKEWVGRIHLLSVRIYETIMNETISELLI